LGIGSGAVKVLAMDQAMEFLSGFDHYQQLHDWSNRCSECRVYLSRGYIDPGLSMPVMLGVLAGSLAGARVLARTKTQQLRLVFALVIVALGAENDLWCLHRKILIMFRKADWTDQRVEVIIANLLRAGVTLSAAVVLAGGVVS